MRVNWKKNKNLKPDVILSKIDSIKTVSEDKKVSYSGFEYHDAMAVLINMVEFPRDYEGLDQNNIVARAVGNIAKDGTLDNKKVLDEINNLIKIEMATREHKFHLLTSLSLSPPYLLKDTLLEGVRIRIISNHYPKKYSARDKLISNYSNIEDIDKTPSNYAKTIVSLKEKTVKGAAIKALRVLDLQRSIWCLYGNSSMEMFGDQWQPINKIRLGNVHTVHEDSGMLANDHFNFLDEPNFIPSKLFRPTNPDRFSKKCKMTMSKLVEISYCSTLKEALIRYVQALDERDPNVALIRLWSALEVLTVPSESKYDLVTRRCAFLFTTEYDYHKQVLEHLREYRNSNVHAGTQGETAKSNCYQLQSYFRRLIQFHLANGGEFSTLDEANSFLDLPQNKQLLENRKRLIEKAIHFVS